MFRSILFAVFALFSMPALAQDQTAEDVYISGDTVDINGQSVGDVFAAANSLSLNSPAYGNVHLAGRTVSVFAPVKGSIYGMGMSVRVTKAIGGDVAVAADTAVIEGAVADDLRVISQRAEISSEVQGDALIISEHAYINGIIHGDTTLIIDSVEFGPDARVNGHLNIHGPKNQLVPSHVASGMQIKQHLPNDDEQSSAEKLMGEEDQSRGIFSWIWSKITSIIVLGLLASLAAWIMPNLLTNARRQLNQKPLAIFLTGLLSLAAMFGLALPLAMSGIGIILIPFTLLFTAILWGAGYIFGTYILGLIALTMINRPVPENLPERAIAAFLGAALVVILGMLPYIGWLIFMAVVIAGAGAVIYPWVASKLAAPTDPAT